LVYIGIVKDRKLSLSRNSPGLSQYQISPNVRLSLIVGRDEAEHCCVAVRFRKSDERTGRYGECF